MEGGGSSLYRSNDGELHLEASNMRIEGSLPANTTRQSEITIGGSNANGHGAIGCGLGHILFKKKRGRPRKYDSDGNYIRRPSVQSPPLLSSPHAHLPPPPSIDQRGPHNQFLAVGNDMLADTAGMKFKPYVIQVSTGEDVVQKILAPFQIGPSCILLLSAIGTVYNFMIRHPDSTSFGHFLKYEGVFEILQLSGSYNLSEDGRIQTGGLSGLLSRTDGHIVGGILGGSLLAASPVKLVVGRFKPTGNKKHSKKRHQHGGHDPDVGTSENPISQLQVTSHEPAAIHGEKNDGGRSYNKHVPKPRTNSLVPSWNLQLSPES